METSTGIMTRRKRKIQGSILNNQCDWFYPQLELFYVYLMGWACSTYGGQERCVQGFGGETWGERDHLEDPGIDGRILRRTFRKWYVWVCTGSIWLRIGTGSGHLQIPWWTYGFHKTRGISRLGENRLVSQEGLCSMK